MNSPTQRPWPSWMKAIWQIVAIFVLALQVPVKTFVDSKGIHHSTGWLYYLCPPVAEHLGDFYQEWASGRNWIFDRPIYTSHRESIPIHLGLELPADTVFYIEFNAHPPTSVLLTLPLGHLSYLTALQVWHGLSLAGFVLSGWLFVHEMRFRYSRAWLWWLLPTLAMLSLLNPWHNQFSQGQLNGVLLPLLVGTWVAHRRGYAGLAGCLLGVATIIKIFPAFLFLFLLQRKQYRSVCTGVAVMLGLSLLTCLVLGMQTYIDYFTFILPNMARYRPSWVNLSLVGFWHRLFVGGASESVTPLIYSPLLAWITTGLSAGVVVLLVMRMLWQAKTREAVDRCYWLFVTAMLLLGPLTWSHSLLLLAVPVALLLRDTRFTMPPSSPIQWGLALFIGLQFLDQTNIMNSLVARGWLAKPLTPWGSLLVSSLTNYALVLFFVLQLRVARSLATKPATGFVIPNVACHHTTPENALPSSV